MHQYYWVKSFKRESLFTVESFQKTPQSINSNTLSRRISDLECPLKYPIRGPNKILVMPHLKCWPFYPFKNKGLYKTMVKLGTILKVIQWYYLTWLSCKDSRKVSSQFQNGSNFIILSVAKFKIKLFWSDFRRLKYGILDLCYKIGIF